MKDKKIIENVLNQIYSEPDLGTAVFDVLNPIVMRAYLLIKKDNLQRENNEVAFFGDIKDAAALESIIYHDLPNIVDIYTNLPLEYRNTNKLKTGQTHRQNLLENMEVLMKKMIHIEHIQYEEADRKAVVKTNVIAQKYEHYESKGLELELESAKLPIKEFDVSLFKKTMPSFDKDMTLDSLQHIEDNNKKIKISEGQIEIRVRSKMKAFMSGVYQAYNTAKKQTGYMLDDTRYFMKKNGMSILAGGTLISICSVPVIFAAYLYYEGQLGLQQKAVVNDIVEVEKYMKKEDDAVLREINIKLLEEFAKTKKELTVSVDRENKVAFIDVVTNHNECVNIVTNHVWVKERLKMDGKNIPIVDRPAAELYCELPQVKKDMHHFSSFYRLSNDAPREAPDRKEYPDENTPKEEVKKKTSDGTSSFGASSRSAWSQRK